MGDINFETNHDLCGVPTQLTLQSGRLGISLQSGLIRMGPLSTCLSQSLPEIRNPNSRFIRLKSVTPSSKIRSMETRSLQHSYGHHVNSLDTGSLLRISSILSGLPCTKKNTTRPSTHSNIDNSLLANTVVSSTSVGNANKETNYNTKFNLTFSRSKRESPSISVEQNSYISGMRGFQEGLSLQRVSEETTQLIAKSRRQGTLENYELAWKKCSGWCDSWKVDPFRCPVSYVLEYLSSLFYHEKLLYSTIGLHRSAISAYHVHVDDKPLANTL